MIEVDMNEEKNILGVFAVGVAIGVALAIIFTWVDEKKIPVDSIVLLMFWFILFIATYKAVKMIYEEIEGARNNRIKKGLGMAILLGLLLVAFVFKSHDTIDKITLSNYLSIPAFFFGGLFFWNIKWLKNYGAFPFIAMLTTSIGCGWYARLLGSDTVKIAMISFFLGSVLFFGITYMRDGLSYKNN